MLPILTKPLIQYGVEEALYAGCRTMAIVTGRGKMSIEDHFYIIYELHLYQLPQLLQWSNDIFHTLSSFELKPLHHY